MDALAPVLGRRRRMPGPATWQAATRRKLRACVSTLIGVTRLTARIVRPWYREIGSSLTGAVRRVMSAKLSALPVDAVRGDAYHDHAARSSGNRCDDRAGETAVGRDVIEEGTLGAVVPGALAVRDDLGRRPVVDVELVQICDAPSPVAPRGDEEGPDLRLDQRAGLTDGVQPGVTQQTGGCDASRRRRCPPARRSRPLRRRSSADRRVRSAAATGRGDRRAR
jgi:hypothetical protein